MKKVHGQTLRAQARDRAWALIVDHLDGMDTRIPVNEEYPGEYQQALLGAIRFLKERAVGIIRAPPGGIHSTRTRRTK